MPARCRFSGSAQGGTNIHPAEVRKLRDFIMENKLWLLLALGTAFTFFAIMRCQDKLNIRWLPALLLSIAHTLAGLLCVKLFAALESLDFSGFNKMSLFGAVFFLPFFYFCGAKIFRRSAAAVFDAFTPCVVFVLLCTRINCMLSGCCKGDPMFGTDILFPNRELEILFYLIMLAYFFRQDDKKASGGKKNSIIDGKYYPTYMVCYGVFRFVCQFFRGGEGLWQIGHLWAALSFAIGTAILTLGFNHRKGGAVIKTTK